MVILIANSSRRARTTDDWLPADSRRSPLQFAPERAPSSPRACCGMGAESNHGRMTAAQGRARLVLGMIIRAIVKLALPAPPRREESGPLLDPSSCSGPPEILQMSLAAAPGGACWKAPVRQKLGAPVVLGGASHSASGRARLAEASAQNSAVPHSGSIQSVGPLNRSLGDRPCCAAKVRSVGAPPEGLPTGRTHRHIVCCAALSTQARALLTKIRWAT